MKFITILLLFLSGSLITSIVTFSILLHNCNKSLNSCIQNQNNQLKYNIQSINASLDNYHYFNGMDISNKNNLLDEYKENIIIYTKNLNICVNTCDSIKNCSGFSKYENYCSLKKKINESSIYYSSKVNLYKKNNL